MNTRSLSSHGIRALGRCEVSTRGTNWHHKSSAGRPVSAKARVGGSPTGTRQQLRRHAGNSTSASKGSSNKVRAYCRTAIRRLGRAAAAGRRRSAKRQTAAAADAAATAASADDDDGNEPALSELRKAQHVITVPDFSPVSLQLRQVFDDRFQDPRKTMQERFMWDYWHVPNQYTLHRTQASAYFSEDLHEQLVDALLEYGEKQLGCRAISPIWMSYYVDGCVQELHCDGFHGPFAFVLSLTHWDDRPFTGGETMILQPHLLGNFWQSFRPGKGLELNDLVTLVEPRFNQLTVFDPRFPHGVRPVHGTRNPQQGRLVLHGWFTEPSPFFDGPLAAEDAEEVLDLTIGGITEQLLELPLVTGTITMQLRVSGKTGDVMDVTFLADTLIALPAAAGDFELGPGLMDSSVIRGAVQNTIQDHLLAATFPTCADGDTVITLPLVIEYDPAGSPTGPTYAM